MLKVYSIINSTEKASEMLAQFPAESLDPKHVENFNGCFMPKLPLTYLILTDSIIIVESVAHVTWSQIPADHSCKGGGKKNTLNL